ncbi:acetylcholine receptor subunit alpha-1-B-like [Mya arenaria]|uniref:acetylcholine receptor subunit alpha-1-B-like n=1 Tax=Mya arenaria TaxID=6604 RepID=UPI0022E72DDF|nr:acetylcholine receptor subunit alpha-1-B-like [Mya arenaria]
MSNYSKYVPPYYPNEGYERDESFALRIRMNAKVLVEIDDVNGRMTTVLGFLVEWKDSNLVWVGKNTFVYSVILDSDMIWKPHIEVGNPQVGRQSMADNILDKNKKILLDFRGQVTWSFVWTVDTRCNIDITYFPFDRQHCLRLKPEMAKKIKLIQIIKKRYHYVFKVLKKRFQNIFNVLKKRNQYVFNVLEKRYQKLCKALKKRYQ